MIHEPLIAIIGSIDPERQKKGEFSPPLDNITQAKHAAQALGKALASVKARLMVYSSDPSFIEAEVVKAYLEIRSEDRNVILVRYPAAVANPAFPEQKTMASAFMLQPDPSPHWEVSFYRSLGEIDGLLFLGGGQSTLISGQVAIAMRLPLLSVPEFGGAAKTIWESLSPADIVSESEKNLMAEPWPNQDLDAHAHKMIGILVEQVQRKANQEQLRRTKNVQLAIEEARQRNLLDRQNIAKKFGPLAAVLLGLALLALPFVFSINHIEIWLLTLLPFIAGGAGALTKAVTSLKDPESTQNVSSTDLSLGLVAGGVAGLLFIGMQLFSYPNEIATPDGIEKFVYHAKKLVVLNASIGFIAGLTWERVFGKLSGIDVVNTETLTQALSKPATNDSSNHSEEKN